MSKQFLDVPVENAKELIERFIADPSHGLTGYAGATVQYVEEVIFYFNDLATLTPNPGTIYFGTYHAYPTSDTSLTTAASVIDFDTNSIKTLDDTSTVPFYGPCVIPNLIATNLPIESQFGTMFYGYKFSITQA